MANAYDFFLRAIAAITGKFISGITRIVVMGPSQTPLRASKALVLNLEWSSVVAYATAHCWIIPPMPKCRKPKAEIMYYCVFQNSSLRLKHI